jgi:hypothetical protein
VEDSEVFDTRDGDTVAERSWSDAIPEDGSTVIERVAGVEGRPACRTASEVLRVSDELQRGRTEAAYPIPRRM